MLFIFFFQMWKEWTTIFQNGKVDSFHPSKSHVVVMLSKFSSNRLKIKIITLAYSFVCKYFLYIVLGDNIIFFIYSFGRGRSRYVLKLVPNPNYNIMYNKIHCMFKSNQIHVVLLLKTKRNISTCLCMINVSLIIKIAS